MDEVTFYPFPVRRGCAKPTARRVVGCDSETYRGAASILADDLGNAAIIRSWDDVCMWVRLKAHRNGINFFYNLDYDTLGMLKHLPREKLYGIAEGRETCCGAALVSVIPGKLLKFRFPTGRILRTKGGEYEKHDVVKFFDISQFYGKRRLVDAYKVTGKEYKKRIDIGHGVHADDVSDEHLIYCVEDAKACGDLARLFVTTTNRLIPIRNFYSGASLGKALLRKHLWCENYRFRASDAQAAALKAYGGARIEVFKRGRVNRCYMADISSAYPWALSRLPDMDGRTSWKPEYIPDAKHSFFRASVHVPEDMRIGPLRCVWPPEGSCEEWGRRIYYPVGKLDNICLTKCELELLNDYMIPYEIHKAVHILGEETCKPFAYMRDIYAERMRLKRSDDLLERMMSEVYKLALNSTYGALIQTVKRKTGFKDEQDEPDGPWEVIDGQMKYPEYEYLAGAFFNPVYAAECTAEVRCKLFRDSFDRQDDIIMYATDSITSLSKLPLHYEDAVLGAYDLKEIEDGVVMGSGVYTLKDKKGKMHTGSRGFSRGWDVWQLAQDNQPMQSVSFSRKNPVRLKESLRDSGDCLNIFRQCIGEPEECCDGTEDIRTLSPDFDDKRVWDDLGRKTSFGVIVGQLTHSRPFNTDELPRKLRKVESIPLYAQAPADTIDFQALKDRSLGQKEAMGALEAQLRAHIRL